MSDAGQAGAPHREIVDLDTRRQVDASSESTRRTTALTVARSIVAAQFPDAWATVLAGSFASGEPTVTSDLDIVVLLAGPPGPYRETTRVEGTVVELFVHTPDSLVYWYERERSEALHAGPHARDGPRARW